MASVLILRAVLGFSVAAGMHLGAPRQVHNTTVPKFPAVSAEADSSYGKLPACAPIKGKPAVRAKSTVVAGAKRNAKNLKCLPKASVAAGKKVLTGYALACFACHSLQATTPPVSMVANMRAQGDGKLTIGNITAINNAHLGEMSGSVATPKQLKDVLNYLMAQING